MTRYEAILRQLDDNEKHHERALAKRDEQILLLRGYRDELEDRVEIAVLMIAERSDIDLDDAMRLIDAEYEIRQAAWKAAV